MKNLKKSLVAIAVLASFPLQAISADKSHTTETVTENLTIDGNYDNGIYSNVKDKTLDISGKKIDINLRPGPHDIKAPRGVYAVYGGKINLGSVGTESIVVSVSEDGSKHGADSQVIGLMTLYGGEIVVEGKNLEINSHSDVGYAYGVASQGNNNETYGSSSIVINADNTVINVSAGEKDKSSGLVVFSGGSLEVNGNLTVNATDAIVTRGNDSVTYINKEGTSTVKLNGNIKFDYTKETSGDPIDAFVLVNLSNADSVWNGNAYMNWNAKTEDVELEVNKFNLLLQNGAQWNPTVIEGDWDKAAGESGVAQLSVDNLTLNDGVINIGSTDQLVKVTNLGGSGGTINTEATITNGQNVSSGKFEVEEVTGTPHLTVNATGVNADAVTNSEAAMESFYASALGEDSPVKEATLNIAEGGVSGALISQVKDGELVATTEVANTVNTSLLDIASSNYLFFRSQINDVSARLGDLRSMPKTAGAWVRYYGGQNKYSGKDMKEKYNTFQIGADKFINDNFYLGGTFSYTKGDGTLANGSTDDKNFNFGIYGGWLGEKGQFVDVIIKRHRLKTDFDLYSSNIENGLSSGNFHNWATSASIEAGWRFNCPINGFYAEPQVEFQLGHVDSANFTTSKGVKVKQNGIDSVIGRAGVAVGYSFPENKGNAYAMASVLHDWKGEVKSTFSDGDKSRTYSDDLGGTWGEFALGGTYNPTKNVSAYGQFKTSTGSPVRNPWQVSVGLRYNF